MGLIWDLKTKRRDSDIYISRQIILRQKGDKEMLIIMIKGEDNFYKRRYIVNN